MVRSWEAAVSVAASSKSISSTPTSCFVSVRKDRTMPLTLAVFHRKFYRENEKIIKNKAAQDLEAT
jgi:hypothetical protein